MTGKASKVKSFIAIFLVLAIDGSAHQLDSSNYRVLLRDEFGVKSESAC